MNRRGVITAGAGAVISMAVGAPAAAAVPGSQRSREGEARGAARIGPAFPPQGANLGAPIFIQITKRPAVLHLYARLSTGARFALIKSYPICALSGGLGPKQREGDGQAPEGLYSVAPLQMNPLSNFHLSFNLGFPNAVERAYGWTGSFLMVHGGCASIGCYAMTDPAIEEIWAAMAAAFSAGQRAVAVHCFPFPMTDAALAAAQGSPHAAFWAELAPAWRMFAETGRPPRVSAGPQGYRIRPG
jgi:murein L,D-transpeptidase YafK